MRAIAAIVRRLHEIAFSRYLMASAAALIVDMAVFIQLIALQLLPWVASTLSYSTGVIVHWVLSSRLVFHGRVAENRKQRAAQQAQFFLSAIIGVVITAVTVGALSRFGVDPRVGKLVAVVLSFSIVWLIRNHFIFKLRNETAASV